MCNNECHYIFGVYHINIMRNCVGYSCQLEHFCMSDILVLVVILYLGRKEGEGELSQPQFVNMRHDSYMLLTSGCSVCKKIFCEVTRMCESHKLNRQECTNFRDADFLIYADACFCWYHRLWQVTLTLFLQRWPSF